MVFILQRIMTIWTKRTRGAEKGREQRPRMADAYPLPGREPPYPRVLIHHLSRIEWRDFRLIEDWGDPAAMNADPQRASSAHTWPLLLNFADEGVEIGFSGRTMRLQTRLPELPNPLFTLRPGDTALIDWNARYMFSMSGANRSSYYQQERLWLANVEAPSRDLFLNATPRKHIDLRRHIY